MLISQVMGHESSKTVVARGLRRCGLEWATGGAEPVAVVRFRSGIEPLVGMRNRGDYSRC